MSDEKIALDEGIDFTKSITNITVGASYIFGLEQLMVHYISNMDNPSVIKPMFEKFELVIKGEYDIDKNPFNEQELHLYTLFSLQQLLRAKAYEQGLNVKINKTVDKSLVDELLKATLEGNADAVKEINLKIQESLS